MSSYLNEREVLELAQRARVCLSDDELGPMTAELNDLIAGLEPLLEFGAGLDDDAELEDASRGVGLSDACLGGSDMEEVASL
ncbi:MAG: hypothetical protein IKV48_06160 [Eggerthellaceae bacterium]|nr:hypothetical protein [Eggerthellaceae bacterium]